MQRQGGGSRRGFPPLTEAFGFPRPRGNPRCLRAERPQWGCMRSLTAACSQLPPGRCSRGGRHSWGKSSLMLEDPMPMGHTHWPLLAGSWGGHAKAGRGSCRPQLLVQINGVLFCRHRKLWLIPAQETWQSRYPSQLSPPVFRFDSTGSSSRPRVKKLGKKKNPLLTLAGKFLFHLDSGSPLCSCCVTAV